MTVCLGDVADIVKGRTFALSSNTVDCVATRLLRLKGFLDDARTQLVLTNVRGSLGSGEACWGRVLVIFVSDGTLP